MNPIIKVTSHPRSGTHFLEANLFYNFYPNRKDLQSPSKYERGHWNNKFRQKDEVKKPWGKLSTSHPFYKKYDRCIYIIRDARDVALSEWKTKPCLNPDWKDISLSEFLRKPLDWYEGHAYKAPKKYMYKYTIFEHWLKHVRSWLAHRKEKFLYIITYEDLKKDVIREMEKIAKYFNLKYDKLTSVTKPVGLAPNKCIAGGWEEYFTKEDIELYEKIIPPNYRGIVRA